MVPFPLYKNQGFKSTIEGYLTMTIWSGVQTSLPFCPAPKLGDRLVELPLPSRPLRAPGVPDLS